MLLTTDKAYYFTDARYFLALKNKTNNDIVPLLFNTLDDIFALLKKGNITSLGVDYEKATIKEYNDYCNYGLNIFDCSTAIKQVRSIKSEEEIALIEKSCEICEKSFYEVLPFIKVLSNAETTSLSSNNKLLNIL